MAVPAPAVRMAARRFPPPWSVEQQEASFVVRDHSGQQLAYVYFEDGRAAVGGQIADAANIAKVPELLGKP
jgi:hypothetical protein